MTTLISPLEQAANQAAKLLSLNSGGSVFPKSGPPRQRPPIGPGAAEDFDDEDDDDDDAAEARRIAPQGLARLIKLPPNATPTPAQRQAERREMAKKGYVNAVELAGMAKMSIRALNDAVNDGIAPKPNHIIHGNRYWGRARAEQYASRRAR
jgi:hypothetical protein